MMSRGVLLALWLTISGPALAADTPFTFSDPSLAARYDRLTAELRCLVCQNQSLADSHADLAQDLRDEVYRLLNEGKDDDAIVAFLVDRYGDFVLYRPPVSGITSLLWFGPALLLVGAGAVWWRLGRSKAVTPPDATEAAAIAALTRRPRDPS